MFLPFRRFAHSMKQLFIGIFLLFTGTAMAQTDTTQTLPNFDKLWNFGDPAATEAKFRELLPAAEASGNASYRLQLLTQIGRTHSLRGNFTEAHHILDDVEKMLTTDLKLARVRYLLERGRSFNSAGAPEKAMPLFLEAFDLGSSIKEMRFAIDAVHMVAIAEPDVKKQVEWNLKGIVLAEANENQRGWLNALYNNIGESYLKLADYPNAQKYFHLLGEFQKERFGEADMYALKDEAKALRLMGKPQQAQEIMHPVFQKLANENQDDGWIREELAEDLLALGKETEAKPHFVKAYELLSVDDYCIKHEQEKLKHLKEMAK
jgi:tetratricopeptide (TPR) repeat protein